MSDYLEYGGRRYDYTNSQVFKNGKLHRVAAAGIFEDNTKVYRKMGNYNLYIWSFPDAALPYSIYFIANKNNGKVYRCEVIQGMGDEKRYIKEMVEYFKGLSEKEEQE